MKQPGLMKTPVVRLSRQRGQAYAEYITITALVFIAAIGLFWENPALPFFPSIAATFRSLFGAYSFALSLP
ncbi:hypothetical protein [Paraburkholderia haematera]|uniref:Uncharacterized protein n=1 Tax=Paraburkholderia haematera TaxID=2793077 RepID=A0ABM8RDV6_9BURK|nr:hypothetical protein [Paraburkholderia haematera]CAE6747124.1 hypothetical protein R69888_02792 [Paraburkholderia haematera]